MSQPRPHPAHRARSNSGTSPEIRDLAKLVSSLERMPITGDPRGVAPISGVQRPALIGAAPTPPPQVDLALLWAKFSKATQLHRHPEAVILARAALAHVPESRRWRLGLMLSLIGVYQAEQAIVLGRALFEQWPDRPEIHRAMAMAHLSMGRTELAEAWAELAEQDAKSPEDHALARALMARVAATTQGTITASPPRATSRTQRDVPTDLVDLRPAQRRLSVLRAQRIHERDTEPGL